MAASTDRSPTITQTWAHLAAVPSASSRAMRSGCSAEGWDPAMVAVNRRSTSYGDGRPPRTTREAKDSSRVCTGSKPSATTAVASTDRPRWGDDVCPTRAPPPTTRTT